MRVLVSYTVFGRERRYKATLAHQIAFLKATCPATIDADYRVYADKHIEPYRALFDDVRPPPKEWDEPRFAALWRWWPAVVYPDEYDVVVVGEADGVPRDLWGLVAAFARQGDHAYTFVKPTWTHPFVDGGGFRPEIDAAFAMVKKGVPVGVPEICAAVSAFSGRVKSHFAHYAVDDWVLTQLLYPRVTASPRLDPAATYADEIPVHSEVERALSRAEDYGSTT